MPSAPARFVSAISQSGAQDSEHHHTAQIVGAQKLARDAQEMRDTLARKMASAQIAEAQHLAREWKPNPERSEACSVVPPSEMLSGGLLIPPSYSPP
jgi:hypothetical protein